MQSVAELLLLVLVAVAPLLIVQQSHALPGLDLLVNHTAQSPGDDSTQVEYRAAATQFTPRSHWDEEGAEAILQHNFLIMLALAREASQQSADIVVFPEYGLTGTDLGRNRSEFKQLCQVVPDPQDNRVPCNEDIQHPNYNMVQTLSCLALELDVYLVVDLSELLVVTRSTKRPSGKSKQASAKDIPEREDGNQTIKSKYMMEQSSIREQNELPREKKERTSYSQLDFENTRHEECLQASDAEFVAYNTQVVFDRAGTVVARYRKKHLFLEPAYEYGEEDDSTAVFTTDFGVTFSLQVCFDIMYTSPGVSNIVSVGVRDVVMSTAWIDELPFLTAPQIFSSWSKGLGVNLVVSNLLNPAAGELGSGIFHGSPERDPKYTYDSAAVDPILLVDNISTVVSGDLMVDFKEAEEIMIKRRVQKLMKLFSFVENSIHIEDEEDFFFNSEPVLEEVGNHIEELILKAKLYKSSKQFVYRILRVVLKDQRRIIEWERYKNKQKCTEVCQRVRSQLELKQTKNEEKAKVDRQSKTKKGITQILVAPVPEKIHRAKHDSDPVKTNRSNNWRKVQFIIHENISSYSSVVLQHSNGHLSGENQQAVICYLDSFCCRAEYNFDTPNDSFESYNVSRKVHVESNATYMLLAYNGTVAKGSGVYEMWTQVCAVVYCSSSDVTTCTDLNEPREQLHPSFRLNKIAGMFDTNYIYPSVFSMNFSLISNRLWSWTPSSNITDGYDVLEVGSSVNNLLTAALFGRWYSLDP